jgi:hypothetical protein
MSKQLLIIHTDDALLLIRTIPRAVWALPSPLCIYIPSSELKKKAITTLRPFQRYVHGPWREYLIPSKSQLKMLRRILSSGKYCSPV